MMLTSWCRVQVKLGKEASTSQKSEKKNAAADSSQTGNHAVAKRRNGTRHHKIYGIFMRRDRLCRAPRVRGGTFSVLVREQKK
jgi:hypothetical protein